MSSLEEVRRWRHQGGEKRSVTVALDGELLAEATAMNLDLAAVLEEALRAKMAPHSVLPQAANAASGEADWGEKLHSW